MALDTYQSSSAYPIVESEIASEDSNMGDSVLAENTEQGPLRVGGADSGTVIDLQVATEIAGNRLEELHGGTLLSRTAISYLQTCLKPCRYSAGDTIIRQGARGDFFAVVTQGEVAVFESSVDESGQRKVDAMPSVLLQAGSTFGEAMLSDGRPCGSTLRATLDSEILVLDRSDYLSVAWNRAGRERPRASGRPRWLATAVIGILAVLILVLAYSAISSILSPSSSEVSSVATASDQESSGEPPAEQESFLEALLPGSAIGSAGTIEASDALSFTGSIDSDPTGASAGVSSSIEILAPESGEIQTVASAILVRAALTEPGTIQAELQVDGRGQGLQLNPDPDTVPWVAEWSWGDASEGAHVLTVKARGSEGKSLASPPVSVTVVPACELLFATNRDGPYAVYGMKSDGRDQTRVTTGTGQARQPSWGPGDSIAFVGDTVDGASMIRRQTLGSNDTTDLFLGRDPVWSPTESRIAFVSGSDDIGQIFTALTSAIYPFQITNEEVYAGQPAWSPDGKQLVYVAERDGNWDIWVANKSGTGARRITDDSARDWAPAWSPDGSQIAFVSDRSGTHQVYLMKPDGNKVRQLTEFDKGAEAPAWSPDGYWLAFVAYTGASVGIDAREIYLMHADGRDVVRLTDNAFDDTDPAWCRRP